MAEKNMETFSTALIDLMIQRDMEQLELAVAADLSQSAISYYLKGRRVPQLYTIEKLAFALQVEPEYFALYRQTKAEKLVREAVATRLIDLEDIELLLAGKRDRDPDTRSSETY